MWDFAFLLEDIQLLHKPEVCGLIAAENYIYRTMECFPAPIARL